MNAHGEYLLEGARERLEPIAQALAQAGIASHLAPPPADCATPG